MPSLNSINEHLKKACENLEQAIKDIRDLPFEPVKNHLYLVGEALVNISQIERHLYNQAPELDPDYQKTPEPDPPLTEKQTILITKLTEIDIKRIDNALLSNSCQFWRKVARVVGTTMMELPNRIPEIPDIYYAQRVRYLVKIGKLESQGNLDYMRYSEVRLPSKGL